MLCQVVKRESGLNTIDSLVTLVDEVKASGAGAR